MSQSRRASKRPMGAPTLPLDADVADYALLSRFIERSPGICPHCKEEILVRYVAEISDAQARDPARATQETLDAKLVHLFPGSASDTDLWQIYMDCNSADKGEYDLLSSSEDYLKQMRKWMAVLAEPVVLPIGEAEIQRRIRGPFPWKSQRDRKGALNEWHMKIWYATCGRYTLQDLHRGRSMAEFLTVHRKRMDLLEWMTGSLSSTYSKRVSRTIVQEELLSVHVDPQIVKVVTSVGAKMRDPELLSRVMDMDMLDRFVFCFDTPEAQKAFQKSGMRDQGLVLIEQRREELWRSLYAPGKIFE